MKISLTTDKGSLLIQALKNILSLWYVQLYIMSMYL